MNILYNNNNNCINCNQNKYFEIENKYIQIINKQIDNHILLKLLDDIKYYTPLNYYNKKINKINNLFNQINILQNTIPQHIWSIGLRTYQKQYDNPYNSWNSPTIQLYCNSCKYKNVQIDCNFCYTYDFTNMNCMCYNCFHDIYIKTTN